MKYVEISGHFWNIPELLRVFESIPQLAYLEKHDSTPLTTKPKKYTDIENANTFRNILNIPHHSTTF